MTFSLNEIEVMGKRAARGAGLDWGLAEEAGKAARWLTERGLPGPEALAELLLRNDGKLYDELAPVSVDGAWHASAGNLCPIVAGAALCDRAAEIARGQEIVLAATAQPLLIAPYAAGAARLSGAAIELSWEGVSMVFSVSGESIVGERNALTARSTDSVCCRHTTSTGAARVAGERGRAVDAETWARLDAFAHRTFAPATDLSRAAGAGAGRRDND